MKRFANCLSKTENVASKQIVNAVPIDIANTENNPANGILSECETRRTIKAPEHGRIPTETTMPKNVVIVSGVLRSLRRGPC